MNTKVVLDVEYINDRQKDLEWELIQKCSLLYVNEEGNEQLRKKIAEDYKDILKNLGGMLVTTLGSRGCAVYTPEGEEYRASAYPVTPVDTTGAGDTFNSSFLYGLTQDWDVKEAAAFANGAAARAILHMGARSGAVGEDAVRVFMKEWKD